MQNKTIAQQLNVKNFPFVIKDKNGNEIYYENSNGFWWKREFDENGNVIYCKSSNGVWYKREFDKNGNLIYYENSNGVSLDNRPTIKEVTMDEVAKAMGMDVKYLRIKK